MINIYITKFLLYLCIVKLKNKIMKKLIVLLVLVTFVIGGLSSCFRGGYGCHGNSRTMTGEGMFKRGSRLSRY